MAVPNGYNPTFGGIVTAAGFYTLNGDYIVLNQNSTGNTVGSLKLHNHLTTADYVVQLRSESVKTSGTHWGIDSETHLSANGSTSIRGLQGVAMVATGYTATGSTLVGTYGQVRADGAVAGSSFMAGLYGLVEEGGGAVTASHVCSAWLDSHRNTAVTGNHELLYMTNNGSATMDQAIYVYGGNKVSNLFELNTVTGMTNAANGSGSDVYINITIDGVAARIAAKYVA